MKKYICKRFTSYTNAASHAAIVVDLASKTVEMYHGLKIPDLNRAGKWRNTSSCDVRDTYDLYVNLLGFDCVKWV